MEAKHAAAREIALAIGVPPMLLGIPGDNTYANYAEANRAFWRQTVLPLVQRTARALGMWLAPAYGGELRLSPDLDQVEALAPEREALWARMERTSFLSDDEKRAAVGYGEKGAGGGGAAGPFGRKYRHDQARDDFGRWEDEGRGRGRDGTGVAQSIPGSGSGGNRNNRTISDATPGQQFRLSNSQARAKEATRRVQELDPTWRPTPSLYEGAEGQIARNVAEARQAEARLREILPKGFGSYESYAQFGNSLRQGFAGAGYADTVPMIRGSSVTGESFRTGRPFDADPAHRSDFDVAIVSPMLAQRAQDLGVRFREGGSRTGPLSERQMRDLGLVDIWRQSEREAGRDVSFMVYQSIDSVTRRGPSRPIPSR